MNAHDRDLAATHALGALPPEESRALEEDLGANAALASEVEEYRSVVETLEGGMAREAPPAGLFEAVLSRIEEERAAVRPAEAPARAEIPPARTLQRVEPVAARRRSLFRPGGGRRVVAPFAAGFAVAVAVVAIAFAVSSGTGPGQADARAAVQGTPEFATVHGDARLYSTSADDGVLVLDLDDVPPPAAGKHYEVWVLRRSSGGAMEAVGAFTPSGSRVRLKLALPGPGDYEAVDVSVEPDGGSASHSGLSLAGGHFEPTA
jgi:anti-sigma-K factor RskA